MNKRKLYGTLIAVIAFAILVVGATLAWLTYTFNATNGVYNTATSCFNISYSGGSDITGDLQFSSNPTEGLSTSISIGMDNSCIIASEVSIKLNIHSETSEVLYSTVSEHCENPYTLETLYSYDNQADCESNNGSWVRPNLVSPSALKYAIYSHANPTSSTIPIKVGYINRSGTQELFASELGVGSTDTYYIYIWLDGELANEEYSNKPFRGSINASARQETAGIDITVRSRPVLLDGLIPVKLSPNGTTVTSTSDGPGWFNYAKKQWANAVLVNENTHTRSYYVDNPGTTIPIEDILGYFVWIPRFSYKVWAYDANDPAGNPSEIYIRFDTVDYNQARYNEEWQTPPAFTDTLNTGFWVGKFETSHTTLSSSTTENNLGCTISSCAATSYNGLRVLPNVSSLRYNDISNLFYAIGNITHAHNAFGLALEANAHMIKNSEWAAIAYLSHSKYGINGQINYNNVSNYKTGCGALTPNANTSTTCTNAYGGTVEEFPQSTTGNVTGVFDMVGGTVEFVMANYNDEVGQSGFSSMPASQYYDKFTIQNINNCHNGVCLGHALNETAGWYNGRTNMVSSSARWLYRGESWTNRETASIFSFVYNDGNISGSPHVTTRIVLWP